MKSFNIMALIVLSVLFWAACVPVGDDDDSTGTGDFTALYNDYFQKCTDCHMPDADGRTSDTEQTLDFTDADTAYSTISSGKASGLTGNQEACNGVYFVGTSPETSLIMAVLDESVRSGFYVESNPDCDADAISDMTAKVGSAPSNDFINDLGAWIDDMNSAVARP